MMSISEDIKVLIVEDEFLVSEMLAEQLEQNGFQVVGRAADGLKAVEMTFNLKPDVILLDIELPKLNGLEAARQIFNEQPTPIVVLTAYDSLAFVEKASQVGVGAYLVKPPGAQEIERAILIAIARFQDLLKLHKLNLELKQKNEELREALDKIKVLSGYLPICSYCKKIRDDSGYWEQLEIFIRDHSEAVFTHSICPDCEKKLIDELEK